jgi:hypothetical protein
MTENRVLRRISGILEGWRRLHNDDLHNLYASRYTNMEKIRNAYKFLVRKPERKRLLGRPRCRWKN